MTPLKHLRRSCSETISTNCLMKTAIKLAWLTLKNQMKSFFDSCVISVLTDYQIQYKTKEFLKMWVFTQNLHLKLLTFQITSKCKGHLATLKLTKTQKADFSIVTKKQVIVQNKPITFLQCKLRNTVIDPRTLFHFTTWQSKHHPSPLAQSVSKTRQAFGERFEER